MKETAAAGAYFLTITSHDSFLASLRYLDDVFLRAAARVPRTERADRTCGRRDCEPTAGHRVSVHLLNVKVHTIQVFTAVKDLLDILAHNAVNFRELVIDLLQS